MKEGVIENALSSRKCKHVGENTTNKLILRPPLIWSVLFCTNHVSSDPGVWDEFEHKANSPHLMPAVCNTSLSHHYLSTRLTSSPTARLDSIRLPSKGAWTASRPEGLVREVKEVRSRQTMRCNATQQTCTSSISLCTRCDSTSYRRVMMMQSREICRYSAAGL